MVDGFDITTSNGQVSTDPLIYDPQYTEVIDAAQRGLARRREQQHGSTVNLSSLFAAHAADSTESGGTDKKEEVVRPHGSVALDRLKRDFTCDHAGMAELFLDRYGDQVRWNEDNQRFMVHLAGQGRWHEDGKSHEEIWRMARKLALEVNEECESHITEQDVRDMYSSNKDVKSEAQRKVEGIRKWYAVFRGAGNMNGVVRSVVPAAQVCRTTDFDTSSHLLNLANGTYDVTTGELREHRQEDLLAHRVDAAYRPDLADQPLEKVAPHFYRLLHRMCGAQGEVSQEVHAERFAAVCRWLGYQLHGANPEKKMGVFEGATDIGKNQALEVVGKILGDHLAWLAGRPALLVKSRGERHDAEESRLAGTRMALVNELTENQILDEGQVLRFVNPEGSTVGLRRMRQDIQDVAVTWKLNISTNELPRARITPQVSNRLAIFKLSQVPVPKTEQYDVKRAIFRGHEEEAVLAHLVAWWRAWYVQRHEDGAATGLVITTEMQESLSTFQAENIDLVSQFFQECCEVSAEAKLPNTKPIWEAFQLWMKEQHPGEDIKFVTGRDRFNKRLGALDGVEIVRQATGGTTVIRGLYGIRLAPGEPDTFMSMIHRSH
jgi:P4 family phage/plasmid primase-like protien